MTPEKFERRRKHEGMVYETLTKKIVLKRMPMKKQKKYRQKIKVSHLDYNFLQYSHIIRKWAMRNYKLSPRQLDVLFYLYPISIFTKKQFHGFVKELGISDYTLFAFLVDNGWITEWAKEGQKKFYVVSHKGNGLMKKIHKMHMLEEEIPMSERRNVIVRSRKSKDKELVDLFKIFNEKVRESN